MIKKIIFFMVLVCSFKPGFAKLHLPHIFSENMVLQRNIAIPVWGWADPGEKVAVSLHGQQKAIIASKDGSWQVLLNPEKEGGPYDLVIEAKEKIRFGNVMVGEVWICSGQSNMQMPLAGWGKVENYRKEIAAATYPAIRFLQVQSAVSNLPLDDIQAEGGSWRECSPATVAEFSSTAYFFARKLYEETGIPIGLIHSSWGGTVAEAWTSGKTLLKMPDFAKQVLQIRREHNPDSVMQKQYDADMMAWAKRANGSDMGFQKGVPVWADVKMDFSSWEEMNLPGLWEIAGFLDLDGIVWYKKKVSIPEGWLGQDLKVSLGMIDDEDITYFNGVRIGATNEWDQPRVYTIPAKLIRKGENTITIRIVDNGGGGGMYGDKNTVYMRTENGDSISLAGLWKYKVAVDFAKVPGKPKNTTGPNRPTVLFNAMIHPLIPFAIRGVIWYQGESNADRAEQYRTLFPALISDWRALWRQGNFPFYFVQLANYTQRLPEPAASDWAELREAQLLSLKLPNTGMAVTIDIGDADDIHPKNKQEVGARLALIAEHDLYGKDVVFSGPVYDSAKINGSSIRLYFHHTEGGLKSVGDQPLRGFAIAGADKKFYWASVQIEGTQLLVSAPEVPHPVAVRYAWANNPEANLTNASGLPASPFRTDNWAMITAGKK